MLYIELRSKAALVQVYKTLQSSQEGVLKGRGIVRSSPSAFSLEAKTNLRDMTGLVEFTTPAQGLWCYSFFFCGGKTLTLLNPVGEFCETAAVNEPRYSAFIITHWKHPPSTSPPLLTIVSQSDVYSLAKYFVIVLLLTVTSQGSGQPVGLWVVGRTETDKTRRLTSLFLQESKRCRQRWVVLIPQTCGINLYRVLC